MMNLQRREEIRVIAECPNDRHWAQEMRRAVAELLAHIDTLEQTAAERVIADGSRGPTPDYTGEGSAWVPPAESHSIGTADSVYFRRELESLAQRLPSADGPWLARYLLKLARVADSATVDCAPVEAPAVVVPELTLHDVIDTVGCDDSKPWEIITSELNKKLHSRSRAIPAGRVPGEGMAAVKWISVNDALPENGQTVGFVTECANDKWYHGRVLGGRYMAGEFGGFSVPGLMVQASHWFAFPPLPDALRANQGGSAT